MSDHHHDFTLVWSSRWLFLMTYSRSENEGQATTGLLQWACCSLRYCDTIRSRLGWDLLDCLNDPTDEARFDWFNGVRWPWLVFSLITLLLAALWISKQLKALFNNVFTLKKIWAACPYKPSVSLIRCKNEVLNKQHLKSTIKCFKEVKIDKRPELLYSFLPIDCCLFSGEIQSKISW